MSISQSLKQKMSNGVYKTPRLSIISSSKAAA